MQPAINDGDLVAVNLEDKEIEDGGIYAFAFRGYPRIRRLTEAFNGDLIIKCDNANLQFSDMEVKAEDRANVTIIGKAVWKSGIL